MESRRLARRTVLSAIATSFAAAVGASVLGACGGATPAPTVGPEGEATAAAAPSGGERTEEAFTIEVLVDFSPEYLAFVDENITPLLKEMYPNATVENLPLDWNRLEEQLLTTKAGGSMPDLYRMGAAFVPLAALNGLAIVLDDRLDEWGVRDDFLKASLTTCQWEGKTWGLPQLTSPRHYCYRKDLADEAGVTIADDWDWDAYLEAAIACTVHDGTKVVRMGSSCHMDRQEWLGVLYSGGGMVVKDGKAGFNNEAGVWSLSWLKERNNTITPQGYAPLPDSPIPYLATGQWVIAYGHPGNHAVNVRRHAPDKLQFVTVPQPPMKARRVAKTNTDWIAIGVTSKHPDAAWELLKLHMSPEALIAYNQDIGYLPPRQSAFEQAEYLQEPLMQKVISNMRNYGEPQPLYPSWAKLNRVLQPMVEAAILGTKTIEQALAEAETETNTIMAEYPNWPDV
ncbi:MAG: extracellular solute-binding protein [Anaerolineae bacterium]|nr:extracellular solute-binding protein [Anaerolineae bacterium]NPV09890.1 extracellular solute-binding protein [Anaerolineae bacterium]